MLIDWFTIGAQALNFLILVWLLKHFLYKPIIQAVDARETLIAKELADADAKKTEVQQERTEFQKKNEEFDHQRAALLAKATDDANSEREKLLDEAAKAADVLTARRQESLMNEAHRLNQSISQLTQKEVFAITRKVLMDLATTSLEERMSEVFNRRLRNLDEKAKSLMGDALRKNSKPSVIRSAFDLPAVQQQAIQNTLHETFSADIRIQFETSPELVCGIELVTNGQEVSWNIADYLASLEKAVSDLLIEKDTPDTKISARIETKPELVNKADVKLGVSETKGEKLAPVGMA